MIKRRIKMIKILMIITIIMLIEIMDSTTINEGRAY